MHLQVADPELLVVPQLGILRQDLVEVVPAQPVGARRCCTDARRARALQERHLAEGVSRAIR